MLLAELGGRIETARRLEAGGSADVLRSIVEATVTLFDAEAASIALYDSATDRLVFRVAAGDQGQGVVGLSVPPTQGLVGYVYQTGQALALSDVEKDSRFGRAFAQSTGYVPRSIVAVPLVDDDGTIGVLEVLDKRDSASFSLRDVELASVFARQAAVAIRASRVERDTRALLLAIVEAWVAEPGGAPAGETANAFVDRATADLGRDDESGLWGLVDAVARIRRAHPEQIALVTDLLGALAAHADRARPRGGRRAGA
jgi:signal transduction protein with GAF and PtsI domain